MKFKNCNVLITGGASGIGKIMGRMALEKGAANLVIWDINQNGLDAVCSEYAPLGKVFGIKVDVSNPESIDAAYEATIGYCGKIDILLNNAGIVVGNNTFDKQTDSAIIRTMNINATAPMLVALRFLPAMIERNSGHICNIASAAGMLGVPRLSVYCASKWAVVGWSESTQVELKMAKSKVKMTTIAPFFISTGMFNGVKSWLVPIRKPEQTAERIIRAIEKDRKFCGIPFGFHFTRFLQGILPYSLFDSILGNGMGFYKSMDNFTGRQ
ncbi:MAG: SDR family NAD(P)-dependent oxidoreductase [Bacteroidales bacterium]|nr:SDR family NAD(P)-dependent oxidoreductase [Bacteroidales bacterium]